MAESTPALTPEQEARLLEGARALDLEALGQIHDHYYPFIFRYVAFRVGGREAAEDLTSEVFTRLLAALRSGNPPERTLTGWLYGVAGHVVQDHHRAHARRAELELEEALVDPGPAPAERAEASLSHAVLHRAVAELTEEQQSVIALRFGDGLPIRDVARLIGKTEGAVKQLQARAVAQLARRMTVQGVD